MKKLFSLLSMLPMLLVSCNKERFVYVHEETDKYNLEVNLRYGTSNRNVMDICIPKEQKHTGVIFYIHGGGWINGDKECYRSSLKSYAEKGYATAAINYRYASSKDHGDDILNDIDLALAKLVSYSKETYNYLIDRAMLTGASAGGHLSLLYGYTYADKAPLEISAIFSNCGPTNLLDNHYFDTSYKFYKNYCSMFSKLLGTKIDATTKEKNEDLLIHYSPLYFAKNVNIPTAICHGNVDEMVPYQNAIDLDNKLTLLNIKHDFITFNNSGHGLENDQTASEKADALFNEYVTNYLN